jgi:peptidoglycan pentaglycine glycine transferase (the first glycine)
LPIPSLQSVTPSDKQWDAFVASHHRGHLLQTSHWGELKGRFGWSVERAALIDASETIVAGAQILFRRLPYGLGTLAYVPKGPVVNWQDGESVSQLFNVINGAANERGAIALTIEPNLPDSPEQSDRLVLAGFVPGAVSFQPQRTLVVDVSKQEADILAAMKSKTRYNIRLAARKGVTIRRGDATDVATFNQLVAATGARNEFGVRSPAYHQAAFDVFDRVDQVALHLAEYQREPLAGIMVFALGESAWYFFGASSDTQRNLMAPYAAQWAAMRWARSKGCTTYDLWGVPDQDTETLEAQFTQRTDGLWGVYRFKRGFGGQLTRTIGPWDRVYGPLRYRLYRWALRVR